MDPDGVGVSLVIPAAPPPAVQQPGDNPEPATTPSPTPTHDPVPSDTASPGVPIAGPPAPTTFPLPRTGVELLAVLLIAVVLLALGALLVHAGRRPRTS